MTARELMYAFQCCSPSDKFERDCGNCPFSNSTNCHTELCESAIDFILHEQGKYERFSRGVDAITDAVNNLHSFW